MNFRIYCVVDMCPRAAFSGSFRYPCCFAHAHQVGHHLRSEYVFSSLMFKRSYVQGMFCTVQCCDSGDSEWYSLSTVHLLRARKSMRCAACLFPHVRYLRKLLVKSSPSVYSRWPPRSISLYFTQHCPQI